LNLLLRAVDSACHRFRLIALLVEPQVAQHTLDQRKLILVVVDREVLGDPESLSVASEQPGAGGMKRPHLNRSALLTQQVQQPLSHLAGCFVGERDRENPPRSDVVRGNQVRHAKRDHARLAASSPGKDHERPPLVNDCFALT
jgi:hypothetical protein